MTSPPIVDPMPPGEWGRHPTTPAEDTYRGGPPQRAVPAEVVDEHLVDDVVAAAPLLQLAPGPEAPFFDGSQVCAQVDPEIFFPDKGGSVRQAKGICAGCEFLNPCRRYALTAKAGGHPIDGVWGGTTARDRRRIRALMTAASQAAVEDLDQEVA